MKYMFSLADVPPVSLPYGTPRWLDKDKDWRSSRPFSKKITLDFLRD
jgi:hypothetical protein